MLRRACIRNRHRAQCQCPGARRTRDEEGVCDRCAKDPEESWKYPTCMSDESSSADPRLDMCDREQHLVLSVCRYNASALMSRCPACGSSDGKAEPLTAAVATLRARGRSTPPRLEQRVADGDGDDECAKSVDDDGDHEDVEDEVAEVELNVAAPPKLEQRGGQGPVAALLSTAEQRVGQGPKMMKAEMRGNVDERACERTNNGQHTPRDTGTTVAHTTGCGNMGVASMNVGSQEGSRRDDGRVEESHAAER
eukprot:CAMPEP_0205912740 /NCGR_PEP_ID=MMETSP1325-20131115/6045_1 /ASSEMBLY_ACC=CAM_ASM_000708 /TAXON_ID=236786 /ORGANISM="Florenciella sp., Strain RCC1007" /LENGTH=251 /DNA_ID=CAMNT_0053279497 /DNA_START=54 /DNA_END=807 /DNA_ORIENTATION=-